MNKLIIIVSALLIFFILFLISGKRREHFKAHDHSFPRVIFQTWKSKTDIPSNMLYWMNTWKKINPNYQHYLWDDNDNREFIKNHFEWFLNYYDAYSQTINRVDAVRYFFLYKYGGIYADMDFECLSSFDELLDTNKDSGIILGRMASREFDNHNIPNAIMISKPRHEFWLIVFYFMIKSQHSFKTVEEQTGPVMLKKALLFYNTNKKKLHSFSWYNDISKFMKPEISTSIKVLDSHVLYPLSWDTNQDLRKRLLKSNNYSQLTKYIRSVYPKAYAVTYWTHTW